MGINRNLGDALYHTRPSGSEDIGLGVKLFPDDGLEPEKFITVRLSNGAGFYTAGGTTVSGGGVITADQGAPGMLSTAWPVKVTDGISVFGTPEAPFTVQFATGTLGNALYPMWVTGSIHVLELPSITGSVSITNEDVSGFVKDSDGTYRAVNRGFAGNSSAVADEIIVAAQGAGVKIRILRWDLRYNTYIGTQTRFVTSGSGGQANLTGLMPNQGTVTHHWAEYCMHGHFQTLADEALYLKFVTPGPFWACEFLWIRTLV